LKKNTCAYGSLRCTFSLHWTALHPIAVISDSISIEVKCQDHATPVNYFAFNLKFTFNICRSFNDKPMNDSAVGPIGKDLFEKEQDDLLCDLKDIPNRACDRRVSWISHLSGFSLSFVVFEVSATNLL
jgi:hypothetical protein